MRESGECAGCNWVDGICGETFRSGRLSGGERMALFIFASGFELSAGDISRMAEGENLGNYRNRGISF